MKQKNNTVDKKGKEMFLGKKSERKPKRSSLFIKYFKVTLVTVIVTIFSLAFVFLLFIANYWTSTSVETLKRNVIQVAETAENLFTSGKIETANAESNLVLCNSFNMISSAIDADVFMTNLSGEIILCKDLLNSNMEVVNQGECHLHEGYIMPDRIVSKTTPEGYYAMDDLMGLYDAMHIVVGCTVMYEGYEIGYIYAVTPVTEGLGPYAIEMLRMFAGSAIISLVMALILVYIFSFGLTRPMREMSSITRSYSHGDFTRRIKVKGNDELSDLAESLNDMAQSLSVLEDSRRSFVANVSHELKTPMTSIGGFIDGILDGTIPEQEHRFYLKIVSKEVRRLSTLVMTMLTLSKIEAGEEKLKLSETEMSKLVFNALLSFEKAIDKAGIQIEGFESMPQVRVLADENMLFQVAYNLFDNAVKFTNEGGTIYIGLVDEPDKVTVNISNTGRGISKEDMARIFERFYKVDKSRSEHVKGVGLGLNLAKNIVELHGGEISVASEPGKLTTFSFWIPKEQ